MKRKQYRIICAEKITSGDGWQDYDAEGYARDCWMLARINKEFRVEFREFEE